MRFPFLLKYPLYLLLFSLFPVYFSSLSFSTYCLFISLPSSFAHSFYVLSLFSPLSASLLFLPILLFYSQLGLFSHPFFLCYIIFYSSFHPFIISLALFCLSLPTFPSSFNFVLFSLSIPFLSSLLLCHPFISRFPSLFIITTTPFLGPPPSLFFSFLPFFLLSFSFFLIALLPSLLFCHFLITFHFLHQNPSLLPSFLYFLFLLPTSLPTSLH